MRSPYALLLLLLTPSVLTLKTQDWKTCDKAGFCRRGRALSARAKESSSWSSPYSVDASSVAVADGQAILTAGVKSSLYPDINFSLDVRVHQTGVVRVRMDEVGGLRKHYDEAAIWALVADPPVSQNVEWKVGKKKAHAKYGEDGNEMEIRVDFAPLRVSWLRNGKEEIVLNGQGLLHMEHFRQKVDKPSGGDGDAQEALQANPAAWFEGDSEDAYWEEQFSSWKDSKPKGPESLSLDINFPGHAHIYGIPQHATRLFLQDTTGDNAVYTDPYRLYNTDVFEYLADSPMSLYGSIPLLHAHSTTSTVAIFNAIGSETWIDVEHTEKGKKRGTQTHWVSESGILDVFLLPGPTPEHIFDQYTRLTGRPALPPQFAIGYHQCRWNYISSDDVRSVQKRMDEDDFPVDVFWLDIEYAPDHKYFIWDNKGFPDPIEMTNDVDAIGRKMVVIIDPHLKRAQDYPVYKQASDLEVLVKPPSGSGEYEGWCWSGSSSWVDFFNPQSWTWWHSLFKTTPRADGKWTWTESTDAVHIWNDMNEPSVFNGPEITMPKDNVHHGGWEHRDVHNINGMLFSNQTWQALRVRSDPPQRPFVLTRSFYAGSQRFGAIWTGDNMGTWEHMAVGVPMVLSNSLGGMVFVGADVGGFFGDPEREMLTRWYVVGAFSPFFRAHAHIDTKRREPYLLEEPYKSIVRDILRLRYSLLPVWYTAFRQASVTGMPVVRPQYVVFPQDEAGFEIDDQYWIGGSGLLVKPVTKPGVKDVLMHLSDNQPYYDYFTHYVYRGSDKGTLVSVPAELNQIPLLIHGGSIITSRERPRRSSALMQKDPFTLRIALDRTDTAKGELYLDDGATFAHERGELIWRYFRAAKEVNSLRISNTDVVGVYDGAGVVDGVVIPPDARDGGAFAKSMEGVRVEKIVVLGLGATPRRVVVENTGEPLSFEWVKGENAFGKKQGVSSMLTIKDPRLSVAKEWVVVVHY